MRELFRDLRFVCEFDSNVLYKKKQHVKSQIIDNGGIVSYILTKQCNYVVVSSADKAESSYKCRMALKYRVPVISWTFLDDCIRDRVLLDADAYVLAGQTKSQLLAAGCILAPQQAPTKEQTRPKLRLTDVKCVTFQSEGDVWSKEENYELAKSALYQKHVKSKDTIQFAVIELHVHENAGQEGHQKGFRVFSHCGALLQLKGKDTTSRECRYVDVAESALDVFSALCSQQTSAPLSLGKVEQAPARGLGSHKFAQLQMELSLEGGGEAVLSNEVKQLVSHIWQDAVGSLSDVISTDVANIKIDQIEKAEGLLSEIKTALTSGDKGLIPSLSAQFYDTIPHKAEHRVDIATNRVLSTKLDLCQLIKDLISVNETTNWSAQHSVNVKYQALGCYIRCLTYEEDEEEYDEVTKAFVLSCRGEYDPFMGIRNVFAVHRLVEDSVFERHITPTKSLYHASRPENFMGIMSRGLLLPKIVVDHYGGTLTDAGMLGCGIYFADDVRVSSKYSFASQTSGTRLMLVCDVAVGDTQDVYEFDTNMTAPPTGYQSVHGVSRSRAGAEHSAFEDDEYAVYRTSQQRLKYLIEFTLAEDEVKDIDIMSVSDCLQPTDTDTKEQSTLSTDISSITSLTDPLTKVQPGLVASGDTPVPLREVHIRAKLIDLAATVVVMQAYINESDRPIEAKYVFPLDEMAAVCGFEAFINGKHVIGEVKEKEQAHREYKQAIEAGHGAYLMDQDEETPDVFTVSVGNLPARASVLIKITYVTELQTDGEMITFRLPGSVAPWKKHIKQKTQDTVDTVKVEDPDNKQTLSLQVYIQMPFVIRSIESDTHLIDRKRTDTSAVVQLDNSVSQSIEDGFHLNIGLAEIHVPRMWVEQNPDGTDKPACMLTFYPEFEVTGRVHLEVIFLIDLSNSMSGSGVSDAVKVLCLCLANLPDKSLFNVILFGTAHSELFTRSQVKTKMAIKSAMEFIQTKSANMGSSELHRPLHSLHLVNKGGRHLQNVFLISDGHINNGQITLTEVYKHCTSVRLFSLGVSETANRHMLRSLSVVGAGAFEFFHSKAKSKWEPKIKSLLDKASQPSLTSVSVDWQQFDDDLSPPVQAPQQIMSLFSGSRLVVYGYVPNCHMATLHAKIGDQIVSTVVSTSELSETKGLTVHRLAAKAVINDWETGMLSQHRTHHEVKKRNTKTAIIELSKKYSIVTEFTSFVAVEERQEDEVNVEPEPPDFLSLVTGEDVDELPYVLWESTSVDITMTERELPPSAIDEAMDIDKRFMDRPDEDQDDSWISMERSTDEEDRSVSSADDKDMSFGLFDDEDESEEEEEDGSWSSEASTEDDAGLMSPEPMVHRPAAGMDQMEQKMADRAEQEEDDSHDIYEIESEDMSDMMEVADSGAHWESQVLQSGMLQMVSLT